MSINRTVQRNTNRYDKGPEWYTPPEIMDRIRAFYGGDFYDPCPASGGHILENGLAATWHGRVFANPPYGAAIKPWIRKACSEPVRELLLLVPAYTDTQWFAPLFAYPMCFISGRVAFVRPDGFRDHAPHNSVLVYRGRRLKAFAQAFADLGPIMRTYAPKRDPQPRLLEVGA